MRATLHGIVLFVGHIVARQCTTFSRADAWRDRAIIAVLVFFDDACRAIVRIIHSRAVIGPIRGKLKHGIRVGLALRDRTPLDLIGSVLVHFRCRRLNKLICRNPDTMIRGTV
jgi:hypothetical protein